MASHPGPPGTARCRHLYLTGFMGSGKTTVGKLLAERLGRPFIDLDHHLELRRGMTVPEIWRTHGEAMFRRWENEDFAELALSPQPIVLACGGGTLVDPRNLHLAYRSGTTVYLVVDFATALQRCQHGAGRPLLAHGEGVDDDQAMRRLFHHRLPFYRMAELQVDAGHASPADVALRIQERLPPETRRGGP
ncbi:MAG TPA: shikimate kinase [bacterium]|nr:shikimate kinase [bacterium]